jgi:hypothetical protein
MALPATAGAQVTPSQDVYGHPDVKQQEAGLPFGGRDVGLVVFAGAALLGTGIAVRRASRQS